MSEDDTASSGEAEVSARRFNWLFHNSPNLLAVLSSEGIVRIVSDSVRSVLGFEPLEVRERSLYDFVFRDDKEKVREGLTRAELFEFRIVHKDGTVRFLEAAASSPAGESDLSGILITARDITKRKGLERQLLRAQRMETIGSLAGGVAHDLNNILAPILLCTDMLRRGITDKKKLGLLDVMESSLHKGRNIVKQVLTFARGIEGEQTIVQLRHAVAEVVSIAQETFPRDVVVRQNLARDAWTVKADVTQIAAFT